ncbi:MAG TPA: maltose alpha-D-glucosyltransferase [Terriglobia bacterium]|nr:maltose alpha-D-glucosyltransferase [Terriglobia bacterium]
MPRPKSLSRHVFEADPLWYKDAIIYQVHVKSFYDANDDGIGDFAGLTMKLDYLVELGVDSIWLLPFYPSPRRDDGYDISNYRDVHPDYGSLTELRRFISAAHRHGLKVITELVINHTSDQHPWFQRARRAKPGSVYRNYYVWSDSDDVYAGTRIIFVDTEKSNWTWDHDAGSYFWHRFYSHQPDLNFDNPRVIKEVLSVMRFWLDMGIDGLRLDAVPYLVEREGTNNENLPETHAVLKLIRRELDAKYHSKMLLAEANQWPEDAAQYFGDGDECHMAFHFPLMPRIYMAIAQEDRFPISDILRQTPHLPENCQWAVFLRNHDELTLEMVTDRERDYLWETYATDPRARLNLGIRRRLAPLVEHDRRRIELMNSLLLSMPGTPVIYYGDEIGMGDNIHLGDRDGVRTPMQWSPDRNGGFSKADPAKLVLPAIMDPLYGFQALNVEAQKSDPHSLLNWMRRMLLVRRQETVFGRGEFRLLSPGNRKILAYLRCNADTMILCVGNLSRTAQAVELDLAEMAGRVPVDLVGAASFPPIGQLPYLLTLPPYGFYWFRLAAEADLPKWHKPAPEPLPELVTLVVRRNVSEIDSDVHRAVLENEILPGYLAKRRWFSLKGNVKPKAQILYLQRLVDGPHPIFLMEVVATLGKTEGRYQIPLTVLWEEEIKTALPQQLAVARLRLGRRIGLLTDALSADHFFPVLLRYFQATEPVRLADGQIEFLLYNADADAAALSNEILPVRYIAAEQSNSTVILNDKFLVKLLRRVAGGIHPEAEMGRFLAAKGFKNTAALLGEVKRVDASGEPYTLGFLYEFIRNQGDGWSWTLEYLSRLLTDALSSGLASPAEPGTSIAGYEVFARSLGTALAELHRRLSEDTDDAAFKPEPIGAQDLAAWRQAASEQVAAMFDELEPILGANTQVTTEVERVFELKSEIQRHIDTLPIDGISALKHRIHGDFHLGQVLVAAPDVFIIDFEGEPAKSFEARRLKHSALRDVAGLLRSFDYAVTTSLQSGAETMPGTAEMRAQLLEEFRRRATSSFLEAYIAVQEKTEQPWLASPADHALLRLFLIEKAAYEVLYELHNRPAWISYPLRGLVNVMSMDNVSVDNV